MESFSNRCCWLIGLGLFIIACERAPVEAEPTESTLSSIQTSIFNTNCALSGCHVGTGAPHGLDLSAGRSHAALVGVRSEQVPALFRVEPGNAADSYLMVKLQGGARMAPGTARMPMGRSPLSTAQVNVIAEWITAGAQNN